MHINSFHIKSININDIVKVHFYTWPIRRFGFAPAVIVRIHKVNGKKHTLTFERGNARGVKDVFLKAQQANPLITIRDKDNF